MVIVDFFEIEYHIANERWNPHGVNKKQTNKPNANKRERERERERERVEHPLLEIRLRKNSYLRLIKWDNTYETTIII